VTVRRQWSTIWIVVGCYLAGYLLWPPHAFSVSDEGVYLGQALVFSQGKRWLDFVDPLTGGLKNLVISTYPVGTSLLQTPWVATLGWEYGALVSAFSLCGSVLLLARWLERAQLPPLFSLLLVSYPAGLVLGRIGMSDVPSLLVCTAGLVLFFLTSRPAWLGCGFLAGASLLFRDTNPLVFAPLFLGCLLRRDPRAGYLAVGGVLGSALRPISNVWLIGDPFLVHSDFEYSPELFPRNLALYLASLLILVPGGLFAVATHRGPWRREIQITVALFVLVYSLYDYAAWQSSWAKQLVLGPRYLLPILPLVIYCLAQRWSEWSRATPGLEKWRNALMAGFATACAILAIAVHPALDRWLRSEAEVVARLHSQSSAGATLVIDMGSVGKYVSPAYGDRRLLSIADVAPNRLPTVLQRSPQGAWIVIVERSESTYWESHVKELRAYVDAVASHCSLNEREDFHARDGSRLRMWKLESCTRPTRSNRIDP
jgi:hypothetical protein